MLTTTKRKLREHRACDHRYARLCTWATWGDDEPISLLSILDNNGIDDALWALRACDDADELARWFARWCAAQAAQRCGAPAVVREHLRTGDKTIRDASRAAARAAARAAEWAAEWAAARADAWAGAWYPGGAASRAAARADVRAAQAAMFREILTSGIPEGDIEVKE